MSTPKQEHNPNPEQRPARANQESSDQESSEKARAIARRAFLRKSVGVAAPVVMTLQSGPALAIQSITCQDKTTINGDDFLPPNLSDHPPTGFTISGTEKLQSGEDFDFSGTTPPDANSLDLAANHLAVNDGYVRCVSPAPNTELLFSPAPDPGVTVYNYQPGIGSFVSSSATNDTGPVAVFTIDAQGEDAFAACYGSPDYPALGANPITTSCWSSLHPGP